MSSDGYQKKPESSTELRHVKYFEKTRKGHFIIDLSKLYEAGGDGSFECPECGILISPDDRTEKVYTIDRSKTKDDELAELVLTCNKCQSKLKLRSFPTLQQLDQQQYDQQQYGNKGAQYKGK